MRWCFAAVLVAVLVSTVHCEEENGEPSIRILARSTVYNVNDTKGIYCEGKNLKEPIEWISNTGEVVQERSYKNTRVYVEHQKKEASVLVPLIIQQVHISDSGNWTCRSGDLNVTKEFTVGEKVKLAEKNVSLEADEGKSVRLTCEANGDPTPIVAWYKENKQIKDKEEPRKYSIKSDNTLEIKRLNHLDVGMYICKVRQKALSHYTQKTVHLAVQHKPILYNFEKQEEYSRKGNEKFKTEEVYAILNETKKIKCSAIANPPPTYEWYRRYDATYDEHITDPESVINSPDGTSSEFILRMYNESYLGEYVCSAKNTRGTESVVFHVSLGTKPDPPDSMSLAVAGHTELTFNVTCTACTPPNDENMSPDPENLPILGFTFEYVPANASYKPDWDSALRVNREVIYDNATLYTVGPMENGTEYHVRVCAFSAAGNSEWLELDVTFKTDDALRLTATILLIVVAILFTRYY